MLQNIPTHVIAGPLGAGKTSLIHHLLSQRPTGERWAVLVNEFGQIGLDAALLARDSDDIVISEVAGGCLCCVNGMPFQVGLSRLLRKARPDRLFIEPSGLGHPAQLMAQLTGSPWRGVLIVQPLVMVLDTLSMAQGEVLPEAQQQALAAARLLIMNKSAAVDESSRLLITERLPLLPTVWINHGVIAIEQILQLSTGELRGDIVDKLPVESNPQPLSALWIDPRSPYCRVHQGIDAWSIGWHCHPQQTFDLARLQAFLEEWPWRRAKLVIHSPDGWKSFNGLGRQPIAWQASEWRKDSRIELIFEHPQPVDALKVSLQSCCLV
ncbi:cobalamin biosynthesis protein CobW [Pseudomonas capeferrum]|uniref:CobW family GTP-binding protein n=1 Tax=Pseudomonas capeferrum TaxID=1495066 RepID=UPI0015E36BC2|nr:CobW family GTP-binding protein [Pseudomonas capeferrum]MBA1203975.1 cobalamin biosynthesis protein CobW [Pseudomonas capeferrum]